MGNLTERIVNAERVEDLITVFGSSVPMSVRELSSFASVLNRSLSKNSRMEY